MVILHQPHFLSALRGALHGASHESDILVLPAEAFCLAVIHKSARAPIRRIGDFPGCKISIARRHADFRKVSWLGAGKKIFAEPHFSVANLPGGTNTAQKTKWIG